jgi:hypothetical protein
MYLLKHPVHKTHDNYNQMSRQATIIDVRLHQKKKLTPNSDRIINCADQSEDHSGNQIKNKMGRECGTYWQKDKRIWDFGGKNW